MARKYKLKTNALEVSTREINLALRFWSDFLVQCTRNVSTGLSALKPKEDFGCDFSVQANVIYKYTSLSIENAKVDLDCDFYVQANSATIT